MNIAAQFVHLQNIRLADVADVTIIAIIIYTLLVLFKQTRSYLIIVGISFMAALYTLAKIFNLYLTTLALQSLFSVLFVVLVVIFQSELRRFFEYIALIGTRQVRARSAASLPTQITEIVQSAAHLAHEKIGALIIIQGLDPLERFVQGGQTLDGVISESVLESIFDPNSSGHDGAVLIHHNRITQFALQLPLSTNFKEIGRHGTRHSAALGLTERTDALCIVVSEEKGTISLCKDGKMKSPVTAEELEKDLIKYLRDKHTRAPSGILQNLVISNGKLKLISLACAVGLWFVLSARTETVRKDYILPISIKNLPENTLIEDSSPKTATISLEGRGDVAFNGLDASSLDINLDAGSLKSGLNTISIPKTAVKRPLSLDLVDIKPDTIYLLVKKYKLIKSNVVVKTSTPPKKITISSITTTPTEIEYWIPEDAAVPSSVETQSIDISNITDSAIVETQLILPTGAKLQKAGDAKVTVAITIEKK